jgi:transposase
MQSDSGGLSQACRLAVSGGFEKEADLTPHQSRYWLHHERAENPEPFDEAVQTIWALYQRAQPVAEPGVPIISTDEKTGLQAIERAYPTRPMPPGCVERVEFEYLRHGTQALIATFEVATGNVIAPSVGPTRTEEDCVAHIERTIALDPEAEGVFVVDRLNTHQSASWVRLVAQQGGIEEDLGGKGKSGIIASMEHRATFLQDPKHRIRFVYTPKHASWLNQVAIWFSILVRRLLKRASFTSLEELRQRILAFIDYFNKIMAKPFKWTYVGRPLAA